MAIRLPTYEFGDTGGGLLENARAELLSGQHAQAARADHCLRQRLEIDGGNSLDDGSILFLRKGGDISAGESVDRHLEYVAVQANRGLSLDDGLWHRRRHRFDDDALSTTPFDTLVDEQAVLGPMPSVWIRLLLAAAAIVDVVRVMCPFVNYYQMIEHSLFDADGIDDHLVILDVLRAKPRRRAFADAAPPVEDDAHHRQTFDVTKVLDEANRSFGGDSSLKSAAMTGILLGVVPTGESNHVERLYTASIFVSRPEACHPNRVAVTAAIPNKERRFQMLDVSPVPFNIKVVGETTGEEYVGTFKVKPILHQADQLARDALMRDLLSGKTEGASPRAVSQALLLAEIQIRAVETPAFWKESKNGLTLYDEAVMSTVYDRIQEVERDWRADIKKKHDAARGDLEKMPKAG